MIILFFILTFVQRPKLYKCYTNVLCLQRYVSKTYDQIDAGGNSMSHTESIYLNISMHRFTQVETTCHTQSQYI